MSTARVDRLTPRERLALIEQLWDSLDDAELATTLAQQAELDRRLAALENDPGSAVPWSELRSELGKRSQ